VAADRGGVPCGLDAWQLVMAARLAGETGRWPGPRTIAAAWLSQLEADRRRLQAGPPGV
jgi:hypothetical protein